MTSAAEQFASNLTFSSFAKAEELKKRLLFTLGALIVYRLGTFIPLPGIDMVAFSQGFQSQQSGLLGSLNLFAGGAVERMAIFALNIMPYISASIIMQLMSAVIPSLEAIKKEGEQGRRQINQYTRYLTVFLATMQGYFIAVSLQGQGFAVNPGPFFLATTVVTMVGGVMFLLWLGEQITARGVGNGVSLIIFAGIVAELPRAIAGLLDQGRTGAGDWRRHDPDHCEHLHWRLLPLLFSLSALNAGFVVQYPRRQVGQRMTQGEKSHLPLKLNPSGVIPPIFASSSSPAASDGIWRHR